MIQIYKASAGSGKTYTLTQEYISTMLGYGPYGYRYILAVTFTNKATDEMKSRILKELCKRSKEETPQGTRAKEALFHLLNDYSAFSVTTIDRFFQQVLRAFARELGYYGSYRVELRESEVIDKSIDMMLDSLEENGNNELLRWITDYAIEMLEESGSFKIEKELGKMARLFFREDFKLISRRCGGMNISRNKIAEAKKQLRQTISGFEKRLREKSLRITGIFKDNGIDYNTVSYGSNAIGRFDKYAEGILFDSHGMFNRLTSQTVKLLEGPKAWLPKNCKDAKRLADAATLEQEGLLEALQDAADFLSDENMARYTSARLIARDINILGVFSDIYAALHRYLEQNGIVLLSESTETLNSIIDGSDTPFIYERIGSRYSSIMLDEFQDTSRMQWNNFCPLLLGCASQGSPAMIVGDVKQSIYRWRNSDWKILDNELDTSLGAERIHHSKLNDNHRSCTGIVDFNNDFFKNVATLLQTYGGLESARIAKIYSDVEQEKIKSEPGYVKVQFFSSEDGKKGQWHQKSLEAMMQAIEELTGNGFPLKKITVLVRKNSEAATVAQKLIEKYKVITEESLYVNASECVRRLVAMLGYMSDPKDEFNAKVLEYFGMDAEEITFGYESLYDLCEKLLREHFPPIAEGEVVYVNAFLDAVLEYCTDNGNSLEGFLQWWNESGAGSKTISVPESSNAIRIMTIHKSKGLSIDAVIIPFFECPLDHPTNINTETYLWVKTPEDFLPLGLVPLKYKKGLQDTIFADEYRNEREMSAIDAINETYVAFTRAKQAMYVFAEEPKAAAGAKKDGVKGAETVSRLLQVHLGGVELFESGEPQRYIEPENEEDIAEDIKCREFMSVRPEGNGEGRARLRLALRGGDFFEEGSNRIRGIVLHDILASVRRAEDLPAAVEVAVRSGELRNDDAQSALCQLGALISSDTHGWFSPDAEIHNELTIINPDGSVDRPDRVVIKGDEVDVVDYKFGEERRSHHAQVRRYMAQLSAMGHTRINGYLWYANDNRIVAVKSAHEQKHV